MPHGFLYLAEPSTPFLISYIIAGFFIWFLLSAFIQFGGIKHQSPSIAEAAMPLIITTIILPSEFSGPIPLMMG
ncbi:MAG: hypothetical protein ACTSYC_11990 [Promethearchaeota archaeon]